MPYRKKLIEVALPLDAINAESAREKSIRHGHPSTLHLWWARRPLAACRAVLFSQMVDDPSEYMPDEELANTERERLFTLIEELVKWENINNEEVLDRARLEIACSVARDLGEPVPVGREAIREFLSTKAPPVLDPFAGGGSIPLEAQRLGLRAYASDLNPVAVLINKAMIEIPPKFANMPPVHPPENKEQQLSLMKKEWKGTEGLAEDVRYYGKWMRDEAEKRIGHLYPKYKITQELLDERPDLKAQGLKPDDELTIIAWLWARTVTCPNPACNANMPLVRSFGVSTKKGKEAWVVPTRKQNGNISYSVKVGKHPNFQSTISRSGAFCIFCGNPVNLDHIKSEGINQNLGARLIAIVAEARGGRVYLSPNLEQEAVPLSVRPDWAPDIELSTHPQYMGVPRYGLTKHSDLYTSRQLITITTLIDAAQKSSIAAKKDALKTGMDTSGASDYARSILTYLAFAIDKGANIWSSISSWMNDRGAMRETFARQAISMIWDYAEANPFCNSGGNFNLFLERIADTIEYVPSITVGTVWQDDAVKSVNVLEKAVFCTDPPYYDNVPYADLSDYFYVWLRRSVGNYYPSLFSTFLTPKMPELVADLVRHKGREQARHFFEEGMVKVFTGMRATSHLYFPTCVFYAFKQTEEGGEIQGEFSNSTEISSTGWETMLEGLLQAGYSITGTWPMRTEGSGRIRGIGSNALASSIILVCRPRSINANSITRREFLSILKRELPRSMHQLQQGSIAPVDLAQASIGPGMAVYSRYSKVLEADGSPMSVRTALALINQALDEFLAEQEGEYDADTRWVLAWYEQYGFNEGPFGVAETLSKAKNTSMGGLEEAGVLVARAGKVHLLARTEMKEEWDPTQDKRPTAWEAVQHLIRALDTHGEQGAALLLSRLGSLGETARDLAYRLYTICERKGWAQDALGYNMLVVAWPRLKELARSTRPPEQERLL